MLWFLVPTILGIVFLREGVIVTKITGIAMAQVGLCSF